MHFSDIIGHNFWFLNWQKFHLQPLATLEFFSSDLYIMQIWSINIHYIFKMSRYTNIFYIGMYLVPIYIKRFVLRVCCIFSFICGSVNCMSWVSKLNKFFLRCTETEARFMFEDFNIVLYGKFISYSPILFKLFYLVCKLFKGLFQPLCQSVNFISWVFES